MASRVERKRRRRRKELEVASSGSVSFSAPKQEMHPIPREAPENRLGQHQFRQQHCKVRSGGPREATTSAIHVRSSGGDGVGNNYCPIKPRTNHFKMSASSLLLSTTTTTTTTTTTALAAFTTSIAILLLVNLIICPASASTSAGQPQSQPTTATSTTVIQAPGSSSKGRYRTMYACEDRQLNMDCEAGFKINLIRANFGRFSIQQCNEQGQLDLSIDCMSPNSFRIMNERCQGRQKCFVNATSAIFTDKCPKTRKYLEVHFQCQPDETPRVDLRTTPSPQINGAGGSGHQLGPFVDPPSSIGSSSSILPPNNPKQQQQFLNPPEQPRQAPGFNQQPVINTVINSDVLGQAQAELKSIYTSQGTEQRLLVTFRHKHLENMRNPRCVLWDNSTWSDKGSYIYFTNYTHTTCAYDILATSYLLVTDHIGPMQQQPDPTMPATLQQPPQPPLQPHFQPQPQPQPQLPPPASPLPANSNMNQQQPPINGGPYPEILEQLTPIDALPGGYPQLVPRHHSEPATAPASSMMRVVSLFGYVLAIVFAIVALTTIALIGSNMRSSAGAALKSLGNFSAFNAKYKGSGGGGGVVRRSLDGGHNKDLLVINNQNGHQFLYAPAQTTKINSSSSTHILNAGTMPGQHQNTLHQIQQQQLYSGTNGTLSNLSGTGGQSNNYYYGLMGFNSLLQHQQQAQQLQHHLSQHHLNQQLQQQQQQQMPQVSSYQHQANKSTISNESANSSPSSSGVESGHASVQQQQQQQQQSCLMMNNDYNLMSQLASYGQGNQQPAAMSQQQQPTLTLNAHYSSSGASPLLQSTNQQRLSQQQQILLNSPAAQLREHIYECVDDDKPYGARMLIGNQLDDQLFNAATLSQAMNQQQQQQQRSMTMSSRLIQSAYQQQQQLQPVQIQQQQNNNSVSNNKRLFSHPAIIRDNQTTKTNIICSKLAQVTPQRATEINKFQHDVMAIYNSNCDTTTTSTTTAGTNSTAASSCYGMAREDIIGQQPPQQHQVKNKLSTDC